MTTREGAAASLIDRLNAETRAWSFEIANHHILADEVVVLGRLIVDGVSKNYAMGTKIKPVDLESRSYVGELGEPIRYGSDDVLPLLAECGFRWVRVLDFNELALEMLGDYQRDRQFRFQRI